SDLLIRPTGPWLEGSYRRRLPLPPRIPPRIRRISWRPSWLLAERIALFATDVASESRTAPRGPIVGRKAAVTVPKASARLHSLVCSPAGAPAAPGGAPSVW